MEKPTYELDPQLAERLARLRELGCAYVDVPTSTKKPSDAMPGQIWSTRSLSSPDSPTESPVWVLLLQKLAGQVRGRQLFEVAPLFHEHELAGPHDALLPAGIVGFPCAVALGTRLTVLQDSLGEYRATIPDSVLGSLTAFCRKSHAAVFAAHAVYTGAPYLGRSDIRIRFHQELAEGLDYLWEPVASALDTTSIDFGKNVPSNAAIPAPWEESESEMTSHLAAREFVSLQSIQEALAEHEFDLAADSDETDIDERVPRKRALRADGGAKSVVRDVFEVLAYSVFIGVYLTPGRPNIVLLVHDSDDEPSNVLDGSNIIVKGGTNLASIQKAGALLPLSAALSEVGLRLASGELLLWRRLSN